jgi:hypothetical protein
VSNAELSGLFATDHQRPRPPQDARAEPVKALCAQFRERLPAAHPDDIVKMLSALRISCTRDSRLLRQIQKAATYSRDMVCNVAYLFVREGEREGGLKNVLHEHCVLPNSSVTYRAVEWGVTTSLHGFLGSPGVVPASRAQNIATGSTDTLLTDLTAAAAEHECRGGCRAGPGIRAL